MNTFPTPRLHARACAIALAILLTACATKTTANVAIKPDPTRVACAAFQRISWSSRDTTATILEVKQHNAAWSAICGKGAP